METNLQAPWDTKALSEDGSFKGHAAIFGNVDEGYDIVEKGAFTEIVTNPAGKSVVLWMHKQDSPIATAILTPDAKGLAVEGQLVMADPLAQKVYAHLKAGTVSGMSFGYDILPGGAEIDKKGVRRLRSLKVWEASIVTFGMNPKAQVEAVKSAEKLKTIREFEEFLRDGAGFSQQQAKALAAGGWPALNNSCRDGTVDEDLVKSWLNDVSAIIRN